MLKAVIEFSLRNRFLILLAAAALVLAGIFALRNLPLDAIPDLSDTQVIIYTEWPGRLPGSFRTSDLSDHDEDAFRAAREGRCAVTRSTAIPLFTSSSRMAPIRIGRAAGC